MFSEKGYNAPMGDVHHELVLETSGGLMGADTCKTVAYYFDHFAEHLTDTHIASAMH